VKGSLVRTARRLLVVLALVALAGPAAAQQRPLDTQDPETIGAGRMMIEGGADYSHGVTYPLSGLKGNLWRVPTLGVNVGVGPIADLQFYGGPYDVLSITSRDPAAPLSSAVTATGDSTHAVDDLRIGMKVRVLSETARRPSFGIRFFTRLPNAKHASGLGQDTTDFYGSLLAGKTVQSVRVVANLGFAIMPEPLRADKQNDVLTYGLSFARAMTNEVELVGEFNGRVSTRSGPPPIGTESRGTLKLGGRYTRGPIRFDGGVFFGLTTLDPTIGLTTGVTYVFNAFTLP